MSTIIHELYRIRRERGLTQTDVATELNCSNVALSKWENGHYSPAIDTVERWAEILGYELDLHVKETIQ